MAAGCRSGSPAWPPPALIRAPCTRNFHTLLAGPVERRLLRPRRTAGRPHPDPTASPPIGRLGGRHHAGRRRGFLRLRRGGSGSGPGFGGTSGRSGGGAQPSVRSAGHQRRLLGDVAGPGHQLAGRSRPPDCAGLSGDARHQRVAPGAGLVFAVITVPRSWSARWRGRSWTVGTASG